MDEYAAIVVGGGPAGASAGFFLKRLCPELSIAVIERLDVRKFARYHRMCGEGISEAAFKDLAPLRPEPVVHRVTRAREVWPGGTSIEVGVEGYIIDRTEFLKGIMAGFRTMGGVPIEDAVGSVGREHGSHVLTTTSGRKLRCRYLIGADGAGSVVRRSLFKEEPPVKVWMDQYVVDRKLDEDLITFVVGERYGGVYRWEFPFRGEARIGFPRGSDVPPENVIEVHRRAIPMGGLSRIVDGNALLVGDAAALVNPLTAGGIRSALLSGRRAAEAIAAGDPRRYQDWWDGSEYSNPVFMRAYRSLGALSDAEAAKMIRPFRHPVNLPLIAYRYATWPAFRDFVHSYVPSDRYGW